MELLWFLIVGFVLVFAQGIILGFPALRKISYLREFGKNQCYAGDQLEMVEKISNEKKLPVPWLRLEAMMPASFLFHTGEEMGISKGDIYQNHQSLFSLRPYTRITRRHFFTCQHRGVYQLETVTMTGGDMLGVYSQVEKHPVSAQITVFPALLNNHEMPSSYEVWQGELEVSRWIVEDPFLIQGVRDYGESDPMNRIHWTASARTGKLQVYKQGFSSDPKSFIIFNIQESSEMWKVVTKPEMAERGLSYAATAVSYAAGRGLKTGFIHNAFASDSESLVRIDADYGLLHTEFIMQAMAEIKLKCLMPMEQVLRDEADRQLESGDRQDYLLITPFVSTAMEEQLSRLRRSGNQVSVMYVEADLQSKEGGQ
ncbi:DUF58 domain-containing protein [Neobacillus mesonae]|nr:DUF58 domain-containing protein [Neobacillus mesonae]